MTLPLQAFKDHTVLAQFPDDAHHRSNDDGSADVYTFTYNADGTVTETVLQHFNVGEWHVIGHVTCGYMKPNKQCARCNPPAKTPAPIDQRPPPRPPSDIVLDASRIHLHKQDPQLNNS